MPVRTFGVDGAILVALWAIKPVLTDVLTLIVDSCENPRPSQSGQEHIFLYLFFSSFPFPTFSALFSSTTFSLRKHTQVFVFRRSDSIYRLSQTKNLI